MKIKVVVMRNIIIILSFVVLLCGCTHSKEEVEDYTKIYNELDARYKSLEENYNKLVKEYKSLDTEVKCLKSGREPRYFILIRMDAYKYTDPEVWIETTKEAYDSVKIGDEITKNTHPFTAAVKGGFIEDKQVR